MRATERVIEMEYVDGAVNISRAAAHFKPRDAVAYRRELARKLLFSVLSQVFVHQEVHGDLHPGNVMVDADGRLHLIDWGNTVQLAGKVAPVWRYLSGALSGDADAVTDALIAICTEPAGRAGAARRDPRRAGAHAAQEADRVRSAAGSPGRWHWKAPRAGWRVRTLLGQLMSNTQHLGLVVRGDYLHLSRSARRHARHAGQPVQGRAAPPRAADLLWALNSFPARALHDALRGKQPELRDGAASLARRAVFAAPTGGEPPHAA